MYKKDTLFDVVGFGLNSIDHLCIVESYPPIDSKQEILKFSRQGGGQVATAMVALARWGVKVKYVGKVGNDAYGKLVLEELKNEGIDIKSVKIEKTATTQFAYIIIEKKGAKRTIFWHRDKKLLYKKGELKEEEICSGKLLHLDGHDIDASIVAARWAKRSKIPTILDADKVEKKTYELVPLIDYLITSERFPIRFTGKDKFNNALIELSRIHKGLVVSTLGEKGAAFIKDKKEMIIIPGFKIKAIDTTGAGDVFHAGFIYGLLKGWDIIDIIRFSNFVAANKCKEIGGRAGIPSKKIIERFSKRVSGNRADILEETR
ncbi:MAG: hypothetical protein JRI44_00935 [Deltaproteobacteria bacterium]|nr:hypothetical protein [Deltaproteobacteria bacterium]